MLIWKQLIASGAPISVTIVQDLSHRLTPFWHRTLPSLPLTEVVSRVEFIRNHGCTSSETSSTDEVHMRIYNGDSAVVTGRLVVKPASFISPNDARSFRYTNVYVKNTKRWQLVHSQFARIVDKSARIQPISRLERTRYQRASLLGCVGEPLKRSVR